MVSESLFSPHNPDLTDVQYTNYFYHYSTAEGWVLGASVCLASDAGTGIGCHGGPIAHYDSRDGGVTWERLAIPEGPWRLSSVLPSDAEHPATRMLLEHDLDGDYMLFPSGEPVEPPEQHNGLSPVFLADGRIAWPVGEWEWNESTRRHEGMSITTEGEDVSGLVGGRWRLWSPWGYTVDLRISDQLHFLPYDHSGSTTYEAGDLLGGAVQGVYGPYVYERDLHWPTIRNVESGEEWPIVFPEDLLRLGNSFIPRLVLQGPFLRVVDVGDDCLPIRAGASPDAEELVCAAERVLLQDQGDVVTDEGVTWHRVRTPAGTEGWADDQFLE